MRRILWLVLCLGGSTALAEQTDITFLVAGKTSNHRQDVHGDVRVLNYHFFAEIFLQPGGQAHPADLFVPSTAEVVEFTDSGYALEMHGGRYAAEAELEANYPDGDYTFRYTTPSTGARNQAVTLGNPNSGRSGLPAAPRIYLHQGGSPVHPQAVDPALDHRPRPPRRDLPGR